MSTLDLLPSEDDRLLESLRRALTVDICQAPRSGLEALRAALDAADAGREDEAAPAPPVVLHPRRTLVAVGAAACVVALALALTLTGWLRATGSPASPSALSRVQYATTALRTDIERGSSRAQTERDVVALATQIARVPAAQRPQLATPNQVMEQACDALGALPAEAQTAAAPPSVSAACRTAASTPASGLPAGASSSTSTTDVTPASSGSPTGSAGQSPTAGTEPPGGPTGGSTHTPTTGTEPNPPGAAQGGGSGRPPSSGGTVPPVPVTSTTGPPSGPGTSPGQGQGAGRNPDRGGSEPPPYPTNPPATGGDGAGRPAYRLSNNDRVEGAAGSTPTGSWGGAQLPAGSEISFSPPASSGQPVAVASPVSSQVTVSAPPVEQTVQSLPQG